MLKLGPFSEPKVGKLLTKLFRLAISCAWPDGTEAAATSSSKANGVLKRRMDAGAASAFPRGWAGCEHLPAFAAPRHLLFYDCFLFAFGIYQADL